MIVMELVRYGKYNLQVAVFLMCLFNTVDNTRPTPVFQINNNDNVAACNVGEFPSMSAELNNELNNNTPKRSE